MQELLIALTEALAVIRNGGRRNRRIAEAWVRVERRRMARCNVPARSLEAVVKTLLEDLAGHGRRRWIVHGPRMRASCEHGRQKQRCGKKNFLHRFLNPFVRYSARYTPYPAPSSLFRSVFTAKRLRPWRGSGRTSVQTRNHVRGCEDSILCGPACLQEKKKLSQRCALNSESAWSPQHHG